MSPTFAQVGLPCKFSAYMGHVTWPPPARFVDVDSTFIFPIGAITLVLSCLLAGLVASCVAVQAED